MKFLIFRILVTIVILFSFSGISYSQKAGLVIEGTVTDANTKKVIPGAIVTIQCNDTLVNMTTNEKGAYWFSSPLLK
jgi:protocatechuate 3,4-dioxygenase beta subunit